MRIALVIFLFFMATFHILSQDNQANTWLEEGRDLSKKREYLK